MTTGYYWARYRVRAELGESKFPWEIVKVERRINPEPPDRMNTVLLHGETETDFEDKWEFGERLTYFPKQDRSADPPYIYLTAGCADGCNEERLWSSDDAEPECPECDRRSVRYVRADLVKEMVG